MIGDNLQCSTLRTVCPSQKCGRPIGLDASQRRSFLPWELAERVAPQGDPLE